MALSTVPFALQNAAHNADIFREAVSSMLPNYGGLVQLGDLPVTQTGSPSMAVQVGVGRVWIKGTETGNLSGQTYGKQGLYFALNDANVTKTITTANATNPRIDVVYVYVQDQQYSGTNNLVDFGVAAGTPAPSPTVPAIPNNAIALAQVAVAANATSITNANITFVAVPYWVRRAEFTGSYGVTANTLWGPGPLTKDTANSPNGSGFVSSANDTVTLPGPGVYCITARMKMNVASTGGLTWGSLRDGAANEYTSFDITSGNSTGTLILPNLYCPTQQDVVFKFWTATTGVTLTTRIRIDKINP